MEYKFIEKNEETKTLVHEDLIKWGQFKRYGIPSVCERMSIKGTSLLKIKRDKNTTSGSIDNKMSSYISDELEDRALLKSYNQYINYLSIEERAMIKSRYFRNQSFTAMQVEFDRSKYYIHERIENAIIKIAYLNPSVDFLDLDYDMFQAYKCEKLSLSNRWKNTLLRSISFEREFYRSRIQMLPFIMQEKINKRLQKAYLSTDERKLVKIALLFIAYSLPEEHPMYITENQMIEEYYVFMKTDRYLNQFLKAYQNQMVENDF